MVECRFSVAQTGALNRQSHQKRRVLQSNRLDYGVSNRWRKPVLDLKSDWYHEITLRLAAAGIVKGTPTAIRSGRIDIRREEAFVILSRVFNIKPDPGGLGLFKDAAAVSEWAKAGVGGMAAAGYIQGFDGFLRPQDPINRAEVITVIDNLIDMFIHQAGTYSGDGDIVVVNTPGVILDGAKFKDLYVTQGVGTGDFTLVNSTVTGTMYVNGGGVDSIKIIGAKC